MRLNSTCSIKQKDQSPKGLNVVDVVVVNSVNCCVCSGSFITCAFVVESLRVIPLTFVDILSTLASHAVALVAVVTVIDVVVVVPNNKLTFLQQVNSPVNTHVVVR